MNFIKFHFPFPHFPGWGTSYWFFLELDGLYHPNFGANPISYQLEASSTYRDVPIPFPNVLTRSSTRYFPARCMVLDAIWAGYRFYKELRSISSEVEFERGLINYYNKFQGGILLSHHREQCVATAMAILASKPIPEPSRSSR